MSGDWLEGEKKRCRELLGGAPLLLAGPIVRRCDARALNIFVATNQKVEVIARAYRFDKDGRKGALLGETPTPSSPIGKYLHLTLAKILPNQQRDKQFPAGVPIGYELDFKFSAAKPIPLTDFVKNDLVYRPFPMPTLMFGADTTPTMAQASCRKFHGEGYDALARLDDELEKALLPRSKVPRPTALFLTGDQIYADDVPEPLIDTIITLGEALMGFDEKLPMRSGTSMSAATCTRLRCGIRKTVMQKMREALTSGDEGRNQLIGFGEFAAAYLLSWGEDCWPRQLPQTAPCQYDAEELTPSYDIQLVRVSTYKDLVLPIRRALANICTYMIMDDHEVTDDWNINGDWFDRVQKDLGARRAVSNAMAAYWCFQAQGNHPERFSLTEAFFKYIEALRGRSDTSTTAGAEFIDWTYVAPSTPRVLVLNTRTRRDFGKDRRKPPALMTAEAMENARNLYLAEVAGRGDLPLVVVSPVPVLGPALVEPGQGAVGYVLRPARRRSRAYWLDPEAWSLNERGLGRILWTLQSLSVETCVILSGDVHYGCVLHGAYLPASAAPMQVIQFTSSGSRNASKSILGALMYRPFVTIDFPSRKDDPAAAEAASVMYGYAGRSSEVNPFAPVHEMTIAPNTIWDRNMGIVSFEGGGTIGCRFLTYDKNRKPEEKLINIPKETPRRPLPIPFPDPFEQVP